ncbi:DNA-directed RNA polymerase III subunit F, putative [Pediculus humanus corporis]|uniref:DNA-directed RNA polymerase III subunit RPC6 n=1 Tax=Pediculus humanus subsp. corporis TaxID=121224 RepID=E0W056_PEDHC|nr:DNA-directed RNA polymerase III subunit F, putative [Pediculus humanus corporis]EEB19012.1 DNA-directed RNA polymerase III subunit F, putative [Pediculus humanus corporis]
MASVSNESIKEEKDIKVKEQSEVSEDAVSEVLNIIKKYPKGASDHEIQSEAPSLIPEDRVAILNKLLSTGHIDLFNQGGKLIYKFKDVAKGDSVKGADNEEKVVYSIVEAAGNKGIWIRDIRYQSNLLPTQLNKILKALENKKLIKAVKSVSASKKKVYMLYNLEPDKSLTGGAWYSDQDFEAEFVGVLSQQCYRFLQQKQEKLKDFNGSPRQWKNMSYASSKEVWKFISELGISRVMLSVEDIETILDTIVYDGKVEKAVDVDLTKIYRAVEPLLPAPGIVQTPCGVCPVYQFCGDVGSVTPKKCEYLRNWLDS